MNSVQRVIKYCAIAFAGFIIIVIISAILGAGLIVERIFNGDDYVHDANWSEVVSVGEIEGRENIKNLRLELKATSLRVERGEKFEVLADDARIKVRKNGDAVLVYEDREWYDWADQGGLLKVRLPEKDLESFALDAGAGKIVIDGIEAADLDLKLGAGRVELNNIIATNSAKIDGGAGYLSISDSELRNLDLDMGVGKVELGVKLTGKADIDAGVGHLVLNLSGSEDDYKIMVDKGLGAVKINGRDWSGDSNAGTGKTEIKIDGGVGAIDIRTD